VVRKARLRLFNWSSPNIRVCCTTLLASNSRFFMLQARDTIGSWPWINGIDRAAEEEEEEGVEFGCITTKERPSRSKKLRFSKLTLSGDYEGLTRRRIGRGGR